MRPPPIAVSRNRTAVIVGLLHQVILAGYWSAIRLHALGIPVAALMRWSVSAEQIAPLRERGTRSVTLLLDGDEPGRHGRERAVPGLSSSFFVQAPLLPSGEKPDITIREALALAGLTV